MRLSRKFREPIDEALYAPFERFQIDTKIGGGSTFTIHGTIRNWGDSRDRGPLRYVQALVDGLERGGYESEVTLYRTSEERL